jgi:Astacin (Peptidase family M12A)
MIEGAHSEKDGTLTEEFMQRTITTLVCSVVLLHLFAGVLVAQTSAPSVRLGGSSTNQWETDQTSVDLQGTAKGLGDLNNVVWVNQFGQRGVGTWTVTGAGVANWEVRDIALRPGINQITVTAVDAANHSASLHVVVNRRVASGSQPSLEVRSGTWKNQPIEYQVRNGMAIVEGDIILAPVASLGDNTTAPVQANREVIVKPNGLAISYNSQFWPQVGGVSQVPYVISGTGSTTTLNDAINAFNSRFSGLIQFVMRGSQTNYVNIDVFSGGSNEGFSSVGMVGGPQDLDCGDGCSVATWLHEMGHTVGLYHEQQRPDRGSYITFNLVNADLPNVPGNFTPLTDNYQTIGLFDDASVMEYGAFIATKAGLPVIETIPPGMPLSNDTGYSAGDIDQIERLYGATPSLVTVTTNPPGLQIKVDGTSVTGPHTFGWTLGTTHTLDLPADPQTLSMPDGSTYAFGAWNDLGARSHMITAQAGAGALTTPANKPAVTMYEANFIRLQPFSMGSPSVTPAADGTASVSPTPLTEFGGSFFPDRTLVTLTLTPTPVPGDNFYGWSSIPYPTAENPHSFFIQAPTSPTQAVFVSSPVTIIGASITGPNTWNPGLVAYVDNVFNYMPSAFYAQSFPPWAAGSTHTITMPPQPPTAPLPYQSPITTNVYYNWSGWSDMGLISHSIVQPASGTQTIIASFDPFYASYTVPGATGACYGSVTTSPAGTSYAENGAFDFYQGGTHPASVMATATANSAYPGMVFAGWSGSLIGTVNPQSVTIQDQFVPTASFNTTSTPLTVTGYSPATAPASGNALVLTIDGTGFTPTTFVNWNGSRRTSTYVSPTQLTLQLVAGDLANAGGQDVFVGNSVTNTSSSTCLVSFESSFTVTAAQPQPPTFVSLTPNTGSGTTQTFSLVISDPSGLTDLKTTHLLFNTTSANQSSACSVYYSVAANELFVYNDGGTALSAGVTPGGAGTAANDQCTLTAAGSSISKSGNNLTLNVALTFTGTFTGVKNVYGYASGNDGLSSGWVLEGSWTPGTPQPPTFVSLTPNTGSGTTQTFSLVISDPSGLTDLKTTHLLFNTTSANQSSACSVYYSVAANELFVYNDGGTALSAGVTPGGAGTAANDQCTLTAAGSSISKSGNNLTLNVALTFTGTFTGVKNVYGYASGNDGLSSGWVLEGTWTP